MSGDALPPPQAPMTNGVPERGHGEAADACSTTLADVCEDMHSRVAAFLSSAPTSDLMARTQAQTRISLDVIEKALQVYGFESLSLSYNGGKDCLVLLLLYLCALYTHFRSRDDSPATSTLDRRKSSDTSSQFPSSIPSIYARPADPFPAVSQFVTTSSARYHLSLTTSIYTPTQPFRLAFARYLEQNRQIRAIFVGTRRTDPHGSKLTHFDQTDKGWPDFMRVHPVIDWKLAEIWAFLRADELCERDGKHLTYCEMYDEGYTSLGGLGDTLKNPKLRSTDSNGDINYKAAYELTEDGEERLGRD